MKLTYFWGFIRGLLVWPSFLLLGLLNFFGVAPNPDTLWVETHNINTFPKLKKPKSTFIYETNWSNLHFGLLLTFFCYSSGLIPDLFGPPSLSWNTLGRNSQNKHFPQTKKKSTFIYETNWFFFHSFILGFKFWPSFGLLPGGSFVWRTRARATTTLLCG